jgi:NH3-dependent NAD+ synthetase
LGLVAGAISVVLVVGCGGGDDSTAAATITKAEFTKQADAICAKSKETREAAVAEMDEKYYEIEGTDTASQPANGDLERKLAEEMVDNKIVPLMKEQLAGLENLSAPDGDEAEVSKLVESYATLLDETEKEGFKALITFVGIDDFQKKAKAYGLNCTF